MRFSLVRGEHVDRDLEDIFDFLFDSYVQFGEDPDVALERAAERIAHIEDALERVVRTPHQGTLCPDLWLGLRSVTKDRAIFYFAVDDDARLVRVLAIFFGEQEHQRAMLRRIMGG
jgi:plasmid stabilization system protein ParE